MNYFTPYVHVFRQHSESQRQQDRLREREKEKTQSHPEFSRLLSAAVVSQRFCQLLLSHPEEALAVGCNGESFSLSPQEKALVLAIQADDLQGFACQLLALQKNERATTAAAAGIGRAERSAARIQGRVREKQVEHRATPILAFS
jgi:hypothetical protein